MNNKELLDNQLRDACNASNVDQILELIRAGADFEQYDEYDDYIIGNAFIDSLYSAQDGLTVEVDIIEKIKSIIREMVSRGWNLEKYVAEFMQQFEFTTSDFYTYDLYRFLMQFDFGISDQPYQELLGSIGIEESYLRTVLHDHGRENVFYAIYEMIESKRNRLPYNGIHLYSDAIGKRIDDILYFGDETNIVGNGIDTEFFADIGFLIGNELLIVCDGINILFMDYRINEQPQISQANLFGENVIGEFITDISFDHNDFVNGNVTYGQSIIMITLSSGKVICFSHNFGEHPEEKHRSRFWIK